MLSLSFVSHKQHFAGVMRGSLHPHTVSTVLIFVSPWALSLCLKHTSLPLSVTLSCCYTLSLFLSFSLLLALTCCFGVTHAILVSLFLSFQHARPSFASHPHKTRQLFLAFSLGEGTHTRCCFLCARNLPLSFLSLPFLAEHKTPSLESHELPSHTHAHSTQHVHPIAPSLSHSHTLLACHTLSISIGLSLTHHTHSLTRAITYSLTSLCARTRAVFSVSSLFSLTGRRHQEWPLCMRSLPAGNGRNH